MQCAGGTGQITHLSGMEKNSVGVSFCLVCYKRDLWASLSHLTSCWLSRWVQVDEKPNDSKAFGDTHCTSLCSAPLCLAAV